MLKNTGSPLSFVRPAAAFPFLFVLLLFMLSIALPCGATSPGIGDVAVNVGNSTILKLSAADGTVLWSASVANDNALAVDPLDFGVYTGVGSHTFPGTGTVYKYDASGTLVWTYHLSGGGTCGWYYVGNAAVDASSAQPGVVWTEGGCFGAIGKTSRSSGGGQLWSLSTNDVGRPSIDPSNGDIYVITNAGPGYNYNTLYKASTGGTLTSASSCEGYTDLNPADGMLYRGGGMAANGCGLVLYQMNKSSLGGTNWSMSLSSYIASFEALAVQPWSGGYVYVASATSSTILVVDPSTQSVVTSFSTAIAPRSIAVNPSGGNVYIADGSSHFVYAYSPTGVLVWTSPDLGGPVYSVAAPREAPPAPKFVYVANAGSNTVSAYTINATSGALTPVAGSPFATGKSPYGVTVDPSGKFVYVPNASSNNISAYTLDATTGALTPVAGSPFAAGTNPREVATDPSGKFAYATDLSSANISAYTINTTTGALAPVAGSPFAAGSLPFGVAVDASGKFVYVAKLGGGVSASSINTTTGALAPVAGSPFAAGANPRGVATDAQGGFVYVTNQNSNSVSAYSINATTGALTPVAGSPFTAGTTPVGVAVDPAGKFVYVSNSGAKNISAYTINATTGALTPVAGSPFAAGTTPVGVAVDPSGQFVYVVDSGSNDIFAYTINATTGALTPVVGSPFAAGSLPVGVAVAP